jgi:glycosyltransferase involved in cell wall biosynthesis
MQYPKITIITPSYNQGIFLEQTILSVLNQNYPNLEYMVIDGGSHDNSLQIIEKYAPKLSFWVSEKDKGQSDAINKGLQKATGDIINWLNSDDYYTENSLFQVAEAFIKNEKITMVSGKCRVFRGNETLQISNGTDIYPQNVAKTIGKARIDQPETFFHASAVEKMGLLDTNLHYLMDRDWWIKYLLQFGIENTKKIDKVWVNFRLHDNSKTVSMADLFDKERDAYFFQLCKLVNETEKCNFLVENQNINQNLELFNFPNFDEKILKQALDYYFLLKADELYNKNDFKNTQKILTLIDIKNLQDEDKVLFRKLRFRSQNLVSTLVKVAKKWI